MNWSRRFLVRSEMESRISHFGSSDDLVRDRDMPLRYFMLSYVMACPLLLASLPVAGDRSEGRPILECSLSGIEITSCLVEVLSVQS